MCSIMLSYAVLIRIDHTHRLVARLRLTNQTGANAAEFPMCGIPYEELCCSVLQSTDPEILEHCVPYILLILSRITVPIFMILMAFILQFAFTIDGKHSRLVVGTLWTICAFALVIIAYGVHHHSCFHVYTFLFMTMPSGCLSSTVMYLTLERRDPPFPLHRNDNKFNHEPIEEDDGSTEAVDNRPMLWPEIVWHDGTRSLHHYPSANLCLSQYLELDNFCNNKFIWSLLNCILTVVFFVFLHSNKYMLNTESLYSLSYSYTIYTALSVRWMHNISNAWSGEQRNRMRQLHSVFLHWKVKILEHGHFACLKNLKWYENKSFQATSIWIVLFAMPYLSRHVDYLYH